MKKIFVLTSAALSIMTASIAQNAKLASVLDSYLNLKNALISGDATKAGTGAAELSAAINAVDNKSLSPAEQKAFQPLQGSLAEDAKQIASLKDVNKQRDVFISLSNNMITLAKAAKLDDKDVFVQYCPMKKASWLSTEQAVKNPYYGNAMLTCGSVKETIKP